MVINSWVAGALGSAWRAVDQYLSIREEEGQLPGARKKFWEEWGPSEYWDEAEDHALVDTSRGLMEEHIMLTLNNASV